MISTTYTVKRAENGGNGRLDLHQWRREATCIRKVFENEPIEPTPIALDGIRFLTEVDTGIVQYPALPEPTPVAREGIRIVPKIDIDEVWSTDESNKELAKWLFSPSEDDSLETAISDVTLSSCSTQWQRKAIKNYTIPQGLKKKDTNKVDSGSWDERLGELLEYRKRFGHCLVPHNWIENKSLAHFVKRQRYQFKLLRAGRHSTLTNERVQALDDIGFVWSSHGAGWDEMFHALQAYLKKFGNCNVPSRFPPHPKLGVWIRCQRRQYKVVTAIKENTENRLTWMNRFYKLQSIGFDLNPRAS